MLNPFKGSSFKIEEKNVDQKSLSFKNCTTYTSILLCSSPFLSSIELDLLMDSSPLRTSGVALVASILPFSSPCVSQLLFTKLWAETERTPGGSCLGSVPGNSSFYSSVKNTSSDVDDKLSTLHHLAANSFYWSLSTLSADFTEDDTWCHTEFSFDVRELLFSDQTLSLRQESWCLYHFIKKLFFTSQLWWSTFTCLVVTTCHVIT